MKKAAVVIVDDHPIVRQGLKMLINQADDLEVRGEAEDMSGALAAIGEVHPDIVIIDISLKGANGIELLKAMRQRYPGIPALVLSMHEEWLYAQRALRAGARGYVMKQEAIEHVVMAIHRVLRGEVYISEKIANRLLSCMVTGGKSESGFSVDQLTNRELQTLQMIGQGLSTREIAAQLNLSVKTIESYRENLKRKLNLNNSNELVRYAIYRSQDTSSP
ncbi:MAG TPA: response regulator transcription factor [Candidatus Hydrogenedentes bacterium]|nr:response regulator transcription factor [Candidatus Hydrogenedentota bacterium]HQE83692.1 response regulator transcription factor [Candidatus Hydrogenedentota bacterium]HQH52155.1 response regulator transcription factor [Candidatus Hydrogenedentota bacterium]HQM48295.1 response regulator transcription factor [Candidatus Hydrogenedentota bacterium]